MPPGQKILQTTWLQGSLRGRRKKSKLINASQHDKLRGYNANRIEDNANRIGNIGNRIGKEGNRIGNNGKWIGKGTYKKWEVANQF